MVTPNKIKRPILPKTPPKPSLIDFKIRSVGIPTQIPKPIDPYSVAKYGCEMDIQIAGEQHGLDWCIIRPHNVYGVKQNIWDKYRNVLGIWMYQYMNNDFLLFFLSLSNGIYCKYVPVNSFFL